MTVKLLKRIFFFFNFLNLSKIPREFPDFSKYKKYPWEYFRFLIFFQGVDTLIEIFLIILENISRLFWNTLYMLFSHLHVTRLEKHLLVQSSKENPNETCEIRRVKCAGKRKKNSIEYTRNEVRVTGAVVRGLYRQPLLSLYTIALPSPFLRVDAVDPLEPLLASFYSLGPETSSDWTTLSWHTGIVSLR